MFIFKAFFFTKSGPCQKCFAFQAGAGCVLDQLLLQWDILLSWIGQAKKYRGWNLLTHFEYFKFKYSAICDSFERSWINLQKKILCSSGCVKHGTNQLKTCSFLFVTVIKICIKLFSYFILEQMDVYTALLPSSSSTMRAPQMPPIFLWKLFVL